MQRRFGPAGRSILAAAVCWTAGLLGLLVVDVAFLPPERCPDCAASVLPVDYGEFRMNVSRANPEPRCCGWDRAPEGVILAGRPAGPGDPDRECAGCGREWRYHSLIDHSVLLSLLLGRGALGAP